MALYRIYCEKLKNLLILWPKNNYFAILKMFRRRSKPRKANVMSYAPCIKQFGEVIVMNPSQNTQKPKQSVC